MTLLTKYHCLKAVIQHFFGKSVLNIITNTYYQNKHKEFYRSLGAPNSLRMLAKL